MPVKNTKKSAFRKCDCCGSKTQKVTGTAYLDVESEALYIGRWTVGQPEHGMAFLILPNGVGAFVSLLYSFENESFMVVGEDGTDWYLGEHSMPILDRDEVIGTPLAGKVFEFIDEIWLHDKAVSRFHRKHQA